MESKCCGAPLTGEALDMAEVNNGTTRCPACHEHTGALTSYFNELIAPLADVRPTTDYVMCPLGHVVPTYDAFEDQELYGDAYFCSQDEAEEYEAELVRLSSWEHHEPFDEGR